jgi:hypothetical protein
MNSRERGLADGPTLRRGACWLIQQAVEMRFGVAFASERAGS